MKDRTHPPAFKGDRILGRGDATRGYLLRLAESQQDLHAAQMLRFLVFNLELNEGLEQSYATCRDADPFDEVCDHLLVQDNHTGEIVGTYRLQTGARAAAHRGYYSAGEFDFTPYEPVRHEMIELGRACVHSQHRNLAVLGLLWKGIAAYAREHGGRYLIGCSSLTSQDPRVGATMFEKFQHRHLVRPELQTQPLPAVACPLTETLPQPPKVPKLLAAYLSLGAQIAGPPAIDREFKTIDFLTILDLQSLPVNIITRYLS